MYLKFFSKQLFAASRPLPTSAARYQIPAAHARTKRRCHSPTVFILSFSFIDRPNTITTGSWFRIAYDLGKKILAAIFGSRERLFLNRTSERQKPVCPDALYWIIYHANRPDTNAAISNKKNYLSKMPVTSSAPIFLPEHAEPPTTA